jgi:succinyl-diaminopimelate desuccinylase
MIDYLRHLMSFKTVSADKQANRQAVDYLEAFFAQRGLFVKRYTFDGFASLVATTKPDALRPKVMLAAHLDVVDAPNELFELQETDTKLMGRGTFDMQFAIAAYMQVIDTLAGQLDQYDLGIMLTTEEEIGGLNGVKPLIDAGYRPEVVVLPDGATDWKIETFAKGVIYGTVTVTGKAAHGSMPWEGSSASLKLVDLLATIKQRFADQGLDTNTLNVGMLSAGQAVNQVPAVATSSIDIRYINKEDYSKLIDFIHATCAAHDATFNEIALFGWPCVNNIHHPLIKPFADSVEKIIGQTPTGTVSYGASDARFFAGVDIPAIICRPPGGGQHADGEWIDKQGFLQYPFVLIDYLDKIAR